MCLIPAMRKEKHSQFGNQSQNFGNTVISNKNKSLKEQNRFKMNGKLNIRIKFVSDGYID